MSKQLFVFFIALLGSFQMVLSQPYRLTNRIKNDSTNYEKIIQQHKEIHGFDVSRQIELFGNIRDSIETDISQYTSKEFARSNKKAIQLFFEEVHDNLLDFKKHQQINNELFYEIDSLQQLVFVVYENGALQTASHYKRLRKELRLRKKYVQYQNNVHRLEDKKRSVFFDEKNLVFFFSSKGWNDSPFLELMDYINNALFDLQELSLKKTDAEIYTIRAEKEQQLEALRKIAEEQELEMIAQELAIKEQRIFIASLNATVHKKTASVENLINTIEDTEKRLGAIQDTLLNKTEKIVEVQQQLTHLSKTNQSLSLQKNNLLASYQELERMIATLEMKGGEVQRENEQLRAEQVNLQQVQKEAETRISNWLKGFAGISSLGIVLLAFTTNRMNREKQKVTKAYSELEKTKDLLQLKTEDLNHSHRELNHRIKNNLQQISSLIYLQEDEIADEQARAAFSALQGRIDTIKIVHQKLYSKKQQQLTMVNMAEYIQDLVKYIVGRDATIHLSVPDIAIEMDHATDIGLIINELVTNASKYAFPFTDQPELWVRIMVNQNQLFLTVKDNGPGFAADFSLDQTTSFGLTSIVEMFVHKSGKGQLEMYNEGGAIVKIVMPFDCQTGKLVA